MRTWISVTPWAYLCPELKLVAPWKIWPYKGRQDLTAYLAERGLPLPLGTAATSGEKLFSVDVNLFHRSCEGGILEDPSREYDPARVYEWVAPPSVASRDSRTVAIAFKEGYPVSLDGQTMGPAALLAALNDIAGRAGIGVLDLLEERANGIKSRGVYETPGGTLLHLACKSLKHLCWDRPLLQTARALGEQYGLLVYDGLWHTDSREAIDAYFDRAARTLSGTITLRLGVQVEFLPAEVVQSIVPALDAKWLSQLTLERALERRSNLGGTARRTALQGIEALRTALYEPILNGNLTPARAYLS